MGALGVLEAGKDEEMSVCGLFDVADCMHPVILDLMLMCCSMRVSVRERESSGGKDGQIIPSAWWDWRLGLIDRLIIGGNEAENEWDSALGLLVSRAAGLQGMLAATLHGLNVHGTWFHLRLIYSYTIPTKWSNKKVRESQKGGVNQALLLKYYFFMPAEIDAQRKVNEWESNMN